MVEKSPALEINVVWEGEICPYCGQERTGVSKMCDMCHKFMMSVVLALCKDLLYQAGSTKKLDSSAKKEINTSKDAVQELEIYHVLDRFPDALAKRVQKFKKALETEGVWFSHVVAFRFIDTIRIEKKLEPPMLICDPMYQIVKDQVYSYLQNEFPDEETIMAFENVYNIPDSESDGRAVIGEMVEELERMKRLKIARPKTVCQKCGTALSTGRTICDECEKEEALNNRLTIASSGMPAPLSQPEQSKESPKSRGMHWRDENG